MRILWWSNAPWDKTGYGRQTALWAPALGSLGHQVAIGAFHGLQGAGMEWQGIPVYPGGRDPWGQDMLAGHAWHWKADLIITLQDVWVFYPGTLRDAGAPVACWTPVDCEPLGAVDRSCLEQSGARPVAMSRHGQRQLAVAGLDPLYVPHGVDTSVFAPPADRDALRAEMGLAGRFVVGICAANTDKRRKGFPEQFRAFARFQRKHPDALLAVHAIAENEHWDGLDLRQLAADCGITVRFAEQYPLLAGMVPDEAMASWYGALDVLLNCSLGEGFGLPVLEAQACGTPVIVTKASAMTELCGAGWLVAGELDRIDLHQADWCKPSVAGITRALEKAYEQAGRRRGQAREFAAAYDVKTVLQEYWVPALDALSSSAPRTSPRPASGSPGG